MEYFTNVNDLRGLAGSIGAMPRTLTATPDLTEYSAYNRDPLAPWFFGFLNDKYAVDIPKTFENLTQFAYQDNPWVFRSINATVNVVSNLPYGLQRGDDEEDIIDKHPLLELIYPVLVRVFQTMLIGGQAPIFKGVPKTGERVGMPVKLLVLNPDMVTPEPGAIYGEVAYYKVRTSAGEQRYDPDVLGMFGYTDPADPYKPQSALSVGWSVIRANTLLVQWYVNLLKKGAKPSGILKTTTGFAPQGPKQGDALVDWLRRNAQGPENIGNIIAPPPGFEWKEMELKPVDMGLEPIERGTRLQIFATLGVPPEIAGDSEHATYNNYKEATDNFLLQTCMGIAEDWCEFCNRWLIPKTESLKLVIDKNKIEALQDNREELSGRLRAEVASGIVTVNEAREELGLEGLGPEGDVPIVSGNFMPLAAVTGETQAQPEVAEE